MAFEALARLQACRRMAGEQKTRDEPESLFRRLEPSTVEAHELKFHR